MNAKAQRVILIPGILLALLSVLLSGCPAAAGPEPEEEPCLSRPCAVNDSFSVPENSGPMQFSVLLNDLNFAGQTGGADLSITAVTPATNGTVVITGGGTTVTYTADSNFVGQDAFSYTIVDISYPGDGPSTAAVTVDVQP